LLTLRPPLSQTTGIDIEKYVPGQQQQQSGGAPPASNVRPSSSSNGASSVSLRCLSLHRIACDPLAGSPPESPPPSPAVEDRAEVAFTAFWSISTDNQNADGNYQEYSHDSASISLIAQFLINAACTDPFSDARRPLTLPLFVPYPGTSEGGYGGDPFSRANQMGGSNSGSGGQFGGRADINSSASASAGDSNADDPTANGEGFRSSAGSEYGGSQPGASSGFEMSSSATTGAGHGQS
jgi:hypothetical protein